MRAHAAVVARDDDAHAPGRFLLVDAVLDPQADLLDGVLEDVGVSVAPDAADVYDGVGREDVLHERRGGK